MPVNNSERKILKLFLLYRLHKLLGELSRDRIQFDPYDYASKECYTMDNKIAQSVIHAIIETDEYTLEGIAYHTRVPLDVILDIACGKNSQLSITLWTKIIELYIQVKPSVADILFEKLLEIKETGHRGGLSLLLNEK